MDGIDFIPVPGRKRLALGDIRRTVSHEDVAPGAVGLDSGGGSLLVAPPGQFLEEVLHRQLSQGFLEVIANQIGHALHFTPEAIDIRPQLIASSLPKFLVENVRPVLTKHFNGITEERLDQAICLFCNRISAVLQEQAQGILPVVVDNQPVAAGQGLEDRLPLFVGDEYDNLVVPLGNIDGLQLCSPFPVEQVLVNHLVRDIHDAFREHFAVLHFADHTRYAVAVGSGGEIVVEPAGTFYVDGIGNDVGRTQLYRNKRAAVWPG